MQRLMIFLILLFSTCSISSVSASETFMIDSQHTYVLWHINHFGFSNQAGKWYASGTLVLDKDKPEDSKVNVNINIADMVTGIPELDKHLKSKLFFDTAHYPKATFVSDKVDVTGKMTANVHGVLTLHGVSKPETLLVVLTEPGINPISNKKTVGFHATTSLLRSDFGINTLIPGLSDAVKIEIEGEAYQPKAE